MSLVLSCTRPRPCPRAAATPAPYPGPCPGPAWRVLSSHHCPSGSGLVSIYLLSVHGKPRSPLRLGSLQPSLAPPPPPFPHTLHSYALPPRLLCTLEQGTTANWCHSLLDSSCLLLPHPVVSVCRNPTTPPALLSIHLALAPDSPILSRPLFFSSHNCPPSRLDPSGHVTNCIDTTTATRYARRSLEPAPEQRQQQETRETPTRRNTTPIDFTSNTYPDPVLDSFGCWSCGIWNVHT